MTKNSPAGERIAYAKRALEAAEFVDEAAAGAHWLISDECQKAGEYLDAMRRVAETSSIPYGTQIQATKINRRRRLLRDHERIRRGTKRR
jgi:hypothetical protein